VGVEVQRARQTRAAFPLAYYLDESVTYGQRLGRKRKHLPRDDTRGHDFHKVKIKIPSLVSIPDGHDEACTCTANKVHLNAYT